ncbi:enoyl-CoA hydratase/isomerase family protein [Amycolatopsis palatopharyngis]|uniref:enoyl-CoA hydratase/isomerase family protein n=1 Tax=Amycolatopsis palatopharyngis TaxID=187982 RepID=UPI0013BE9B8E|nr:enoyl-CoA hydratase/isomerase family protein [Amycolatopsis palatopharyngis]
MAGSVEMSVTGGVALVEISNPPLNLLTMHVRSELRLVMERIGCDSSVRAVVLRSTGDRAFSAGSDISEFPRDARAGHRRAVQEHSCYDAVADLPQPVVAELSGHVLGGGLELALACDIRVADATAHLGLPEVKLGVFPSGAGTQRLPRTIGVSQAKRMMLLGEIVDADRALELGLVDEMVPRGQATAAAAEIAGRIAGQPALAVQAIKKAVDHGLRFGTRAGQALEAELIAGLFATHDAQEGVQAFLESREPQFTHD